ncbi:MAG TPA: hypothetical protein VE377_05045 [Candidatus Dormibacteraeota bacterium]|nr:hypothetical protein [Candidatus Dormibacteraeota bacterium]
MRTACLAVFSFELHRGWWRWPGLGIPRRKERLGSVLSGGVRPFKTFFFSASGFGTTVPETGSIRVDAVEGEWVVEKTGGRRARVADGKATARPADPVIKSP